MCNPKPGARCSPHARQRLKAAIQSGDKERIATAQREYLTTPEGIRKAAQRDPQLAERLQQRRDAMNNEYKRLREEGTATPIQIDGQTFKVKKVFKATEERKEILSSRNASTPLIYQVSSENAPEFEAQMRKAVSGSDAGSSVEIYPVEEYKKHRLFITENGKAGFVVKEDGDIVSVFSSPDNPDKRASYHMLLTAVENGGTKLDCYDTYLPKLYKRCGFTETERLTWDDQYAPPTWDYDYYKNYNNGRPDVVLMEYNGFSKETFAQ